LLRDTQLTPEQRQYAEFGRHAAEALLTTVNDILDFGNLESGQLALEPIAFDLRTTVEDTIGRLAQQAENKGVELTCLMSHDIPTPLWGDPGRLRQVFTNIIENALANAAPGSVTIRGMMTHRAPSCVTFRFSVTAPSFVLSQLTPLFQPTAQSNTSIRTRRGQWLGLAVSKNLVKLLGGEMGVEQDQTQESTVWFTVTLEKQPPKALAAPPPRAHLHDVKVLVVGDSQTVLHEQLVHWGMTSHSVADTEQARQMLSVATEAEAAYDLVVLNWATVDRDVLAFAAMLRANPTLSALRIVLLTTTGKKGDAQRARQAGIDAYLPKPVPQSLLFECLATLMNQPPKTVAPNAPLVTRYTLTEARARKRPRVLVVDSDPAGQKLAARLLTQSGYRADIAADGHEGVEAHANISYAAVLIANNLSTLTGVVTAAEIRQRDREEQTYTPIIGLIGDDGTTYEQCLAAGMDDALVKPLTAPDLKVALERHTTRTAPLDTALSSSVLTDEIGFDLNAALAHVDGDQQFLNEIVTLFLQEYPKYLDGIRTAVAHHDPHALTFAANSLRGSLSNFAAMPAAAAALRLENLGRQGDVTSAPAALKQLEEAIAQLVPMLTGLVMESAA
jgi:CheY-like chemotaxis protein/HPt (histidine-containing phosphotransfer) domain-containing protein